MSDYIQDCLEGWPTVKKELVSWVNAISILAFLVATIVGDLKDWAMPLRVLLYIGFTISFSVLPWRGLKARTHRQVQEYEKTKAEYEVALRNKEQEIKALKAELQRRI